MDVHKKEIRVLLELELDQFAEDDKEHVHHKVEKKELDFKTKKKEKKKEKEKEGSKRSRHSSDEEQEKKEKEKIEDDEEEDDEEKKTTKKPKTEKKEPLETSSWSQKVSDFITAANTCLLD